MGVCDFCRNILTKDKIFGGQGPGLLAFIVGFVYSAWMIVIVFWVRRSLLLAKIGYKTAVEAAIFPMYLYIMWYVGMINTLIGVAIILDDTFAETNGGGSAKLYLALFYSVSYAFQHMGIEGIAFLMMHKGVGANALRSVSRYLILYFPIVFGLNFIRFYNRDYESLYGVAAWNLCLIAFYGCLWLLPPETLYRRPAAYRYARFWAMFRFCVLMAISLKQIPNSSGVGEVFSGIGYCYDNFLVYIAFAFLSPLVIYRCLHDDCMWWQGVRRPPLPSVLHTWLCSDIISLIAPLLPCSCCEPDQRNSLINDSPKHEGKNGQRKKVPLSSPLEGTDLTFKSAMFLADRMDEMSSTLESPLVRRSTRTDMKDQSSTVRLLNFAQVELSSSNPIGQGSFSKVFRGKLLQRDVAVKLIFTLDLTQQIIEKVASEATILTSVGPHPNVVHIFGVAVMPPSVCLVLEYCYYGSLSDVLRGSEDYLYHRTQFGDSSRPLPQRAVSRSRASRDLGSLHGDLGCEGDRGAGSPLALSLTDKVYLALGCARGLAALHAHGNANLGRGSSFLTSDASVRTGATGTTNADSLSDRLLVHRDIKSFNFLVDYQLNAKLADLELGYEEPDEQRPPSFDKPEISPAEEERSLSSGKPSNKAEHARDSGSGGTQVQAKGLEFTPNWLAPEVLRGGPHRQSSDVYSLGLVLWEILSHRIPYCEFPRNHMVLAEVLRGIMPEIPQVTPIVPFDELRLNHDAWPTRAGVADESTSIDSERLFAGIPEALEKIILRAWNLEPDARGSSERMVRASHLVTYRIYSSSPHTPFPCFCSFLFLPSTCTIHHPTSNITTRPF
jgi:serine/threonine protein kinase